jgi:mRNA-degrading endonuclease RelE of RelBE toxin-antitoxin system
MTPPFVVRTTPAFERWLRKLAAKHAELRVVYAEALDLLGTDPCNRMRAHAIKKLTAVERGGGQYRLRLARWRFRYDIYDRVVLLVDCSLRREDTYERSFVAETASTASVASLGAASASSSTARGSIRPTLRPHARPARYRATDSVQPAPPTNARVVSKGSV